MPTYRLIYFPIRARAEAIRLLLAHANVAYVDDRINRADWPKMKDQMPLKQVPVLEIDGKMKIAQTTAIMRYLAHQFGIAAKSPLEEAKVDMFGEAIQDAVFQYTAWRRVVMGFDEGNKDEKFKEVVVPIINNYGPIFEQTLTENGTGWLVGNNITWADFLAAEFFDKIITYGDPTALDAYPHVMKHNKEVLSLPNVKKYIDQRPKNTVF
uniref:glutathione transferase n=1 Tax=Plectus sambesii TaxID=2011161 RepID=A0A914UU27_9BILA